MASKSCKSIPSDIFVCILIINVLRLKKKLRYEFIYSVYVRVKLIFVAEEKISFGYFLHEFIIAIIAIANVYTSRLSQERRLHTRITGLKHRIRILRKYSKLVNFH